MRLTWTVYTSLAVLLPSDSIAQAQSVTLVRQPDVSYVATTKGSGADDAETCGC